MNAKWDETTSSRIWTLVTVSVSKDDNRYTFTYSNIHAYKYIHTDTNTYIHTHTYVCMYVCTYVCIYVCIMHLIQQLNPTATTSHSHMILIGDFNSFKPVPTFHAFEPNGQLHMMNTPIQKNSLIPEIILNSRTLQVVSLSLEVVSFQ